MREEGYRIILVNSNPATIMTDPDMADATYVEPITPEIVAKIIEKERPDAVLPTMGGQTALNVALALFNDGTLAKYGVEMIGADAEAIDKVYDEIAPTPRSALALITLRSGPEALGLSPALERNVPAGTPVLAVTVFIAASVMGGLAPAEGVLILARVLQGGSDEEILAAIKYMSGAK